jgi:phosphoenolpyruvate synthase/pyruvate phosphate dikinase
MAATKLKKVSNTSPATHGNKGHQLTLLKAAKFAVPKFIVLTVEEVKVVRRAFPTSKYNKILKKINSFIGKQPANTTFSVRSSGEQSMPGAMETKLFVKPEDIVQAVSSVGNSFFNEEAIQYREKFGLTNMTGTACVIMVMIDPYISGVSMIGNLDTTLEYVYGTGDTLVSGKATPYKTLPTTALKARFSKLHNNILLKYGPSDIEWCVTRSMTKTGSYSYKIWLLQRRDLKITKTKAPPNFNDLLYTISCYNNVGVENGATRLLNPSDFLVLNTSEFTPSNYGRILDAKVIVTNGAGDNSHPALVAKTMTKAAVVNVPDGNLASIRDDASTKYANSTIAAWSKNEKGYLKFYKDTKENLELLENYIISLESLVNIKQLPRYMSDTVINKQFINDMYNTNLIDSQYSIGAFLKILVSGFDDIVLQEKACRAAINYMLLACIGELRHMFDYNAKFFSVAPLNLVALLQLPVGYKNYWTYFDAVVGSTREEVLSFATQVSKYFEQFSMGNAYGGKAWARCADAVVRALATATHPSVGIDVIINAEHNGGCAFGKNNAFTRNGHDLLDSKRKGYTGYVDSVNNWYKIPPTLDNYFQLEVAKESN